MATLPPELVRPVVLDAWLSEADDRRISLLHALSTAHPALEEIMAETYLKYPFFRVNTMLEDDATLLEDIAFYKRATDRLVASSSSRPSPTVDTTPQNHLPIHVRLEVTNLHIETDDQRSRWRNYTTALLQLPMTSTRSLSIAAAEGSVLTEHITPLLSVASRLPALTHLRLDYTYTFSSAPDTDWPNFSCAATRFLRLRIPPFTLQPAVALSKYMLYMLVLHNLFECLRGVTHVHLDAPVPLQSLIAMHSLRRLRTLTLEAAPADPTAPAPAPLKLGRVRTVVGYGVVDAMRNGFLQWPSDLPEGMPRRILVRSRAAETEGFDEARQACEECGIRFEEDL